MQVENVAGVSLTAGGAAQQQGNGTVCHSVLGKVVIDDQHALALGHKIFGQCGAGIRGNVLQGGAVAGGGGHNGGVAHSAMLFQVLGHAGNGGSLLPDGNVDAEHAVSFWFRMVSVAMEVLPVWRSPMINSRWPRPMGIIESMDIMPVCSGSVPYRNFHPQIPAAHLPYRFQFRWHVQIPSPTVRIVPVSFCCSACS